ADVLVQGERAGAVDVAAAAAGGAFEECFACGDALRVEVGADGDARDRVEPVREDRLLLGPHFAAAHAMREDLVAEIAERAEVAVPVVWRAVRDDAAAERLRAARFGD